MIGAMCAAAAVLLMLSGAAKLRAPKPTLDMLVALQRNPWLRRDQLRPLPAVLGVVEICVGVVVIAYGGRLTAAALAGCYLAFTMVAAALANRKQPVSCGCFGKSDAPVGAAHVVMDLLAFGAGVAGVVRPFGALGGYAGSDVDIAVLGLAQVALLAAIAYMAMTVLPTVMVLRRQVRSRT